MVSVGPGDVLWVSSSFGCEFVFEATDLLEVILLSEAVGFVLVAAGVVG